MRSHIHELWEELDLEPLYPEPDLDRVMDQVMDRIAAEEPQAEGTAHVIKERRRPMHKRKLLLSLAAALVVLTGSAVAVGSQLGLLNVFFQGDTSGLEPYVQTDLGSAENEDFRFTVNSAYYDGMTVYATVTVEGLNEQAVEDLKSNRADAEAHREMWGDALADNMLETGKFGPDTIRANQDEVTEAAGFWYSGGNGGIHELEVPSDTSRSWTALSVSTRTARLVSNWPLSVSVERCITGRTPRCLAAARRASSSRGRSVPSAPIP